MAVCEPDLLKLSDRYLYLKNGASPPVAPERHERSERWEGWAGHRSVELRPDGFGSGAVPAFQRPAICGKVGRL